MTPIRLISMTCVNTSGMNSAPRRMTPAVFTRTSSLGNDAIRSSSAWSRVTSSSTTVARLDTRDGVAWASSPATDTQAPASRKRSAIAAPMPLVPPMMTTTRSGELPADVRWSSIEPVLPVGRRGSRRRYVSSTIGRPVPVAATMGKQNRAYSLAGSAGAVRSRQPAKIGVTTLGSSPTLAEVCQPDEWRRLAR
jgi:hypothetical protein